MHPTQHSYIAEALQRSGAGGKLAITVRSGIPPASGLGSAAASVTATLCAARSFGGAPFTEEELARNAFEVEHAVQGAASPTDTSTITHGSAIAVRREAGPGLLWSISKGARSWHVHHVTLTDLTFVVGSTGIRGRTKDQVAKVKRFTSRSGFARDIVKEIGGITEEGLKALAAGDRSRIGALMDENHKLLITLGASHPALQSLVEAARPSAYGAKLTGAGGGGCMIALTDAPEKTAEAIRKRGGTPHVVRVAPKGTRLLQS